MVYGNFGYIMLAISVLAVLALLMPTCIDIIVFISSDTSKSNVIFVICIGIN